MNEGLYGGNITEIVIDPLTSYIYAGTAGGLYISKDNGNSWSIIGNGLPNIGIESIAISG
jgi:hypothetical protein